MNLCYIWKTNVTDGIRVPKEENQDYDCLY